MRATQSTALAGCWRNTNGGAAASWTFRVEASNQHGEPVAEYDYTCIFDYAQVRKEVPDDTGTAASASAPDQPGVAAVRTVLTFDGISLQDPLAPLSLSESQEIINGKDAFRLAGEHNPINIHTDEEFARQNMFSGTVSSGPAAMAYVDQMPGPVLPPAGVLPGRDPAATRHRAVPRRGHGNLAGRDYRQNGERRPKDR